MTEQLTARARQLFEGVPGSSEQHDANTWLMRFQKTEEAWQAALQLLEAPARDPRTQQILAAPHLVAVQILRLKVQHEWTRINEQQQKVVRQTLLKLLETICMTDAGLSAVSCRIACATLADIIVKSSTTWTGWKVDLQRLINAGVAAQRQQNAVGVLANVLGAIPEQIQASESVWTEEEMHALLVRLQAEGEEVMTTVQKILTNIPNATNSALCCLKGWIVGCIPNREAFGLTAAHLFTRGLIDVLLLLVISDSEEQAQLAAEIIADAVLSTHSELTSDCLTNAVLHTSRRLVEMMPVFRVNPRFSSGKVMTKEQQTVSCGCISRIACSLAMNHARVLFSSQAGAFQPGFEDCNQSMLLIEFLELLLACSSYDDIDVVQPTLEFWFFFLEDTLSDDSSCQALGARGQEHLVSILSRLVNALVEHCKYPQWFVERQQLVSDDPEIEAVSNLRREIADTLLSLFSKWPKGSRESSKNYVSCVKSMCQLLSDSKDIALIEALLFLLSYMIELFDGVSSESEPEDDLNSFQDSESSDIGVLFGILDCAVSLPMHPLIISGVARYLRVLSLSFAVPASVNLHALTIVCRGLQFTSSFPVAVQSLLHSSAPLSKYTTFEERAHLVQQLIHNCSTLQTKPNQESEGDLLELTFRMASGASDTDFAAICSAVLSSHIIFVQRRSSIDVGRSIYLLGRAIGGVQDDKHGSALIGQVWPIVIASLHLYEGDVCCRRAGILVFRNVIPHLQKDGGPIEAQILEVCLCWYGKGIAPDILACCSQIFARQRGNTGFLVSAEQTFEHLLFGFRSKLHDISEEKSSRGNESMEIFLSQHCEATSMIPEVKEFMELAQEVLRSFPQILTNNRRNKEPSLYWICLDLAFRLVKVDHQMQEMCDAACSFLLCAMRCQSELLLEKIHMFSLEIVRVVLSFIDPRRKHYCVRSLWDFLFQCMHAPDISVQIRGR